jgi:flagella basal body P-ring formation protein FlgA
MMRRFLPFLTVLAVLCAPVLACAGTPVELKAEIVSHGASVTLGDLFEGVRGPDAGVVLAHAAQTGLDAVLDAGSVQMTASRAGYDWPNASGFRRIAVSSQPGEAAKSPPDHPTRAKAVRHSRANQALTYARNIMAGDILSADDLVWSDDVAAPSDGVSNPEAAIGKSARHALRAGAAATAHDLVSPTVIKRDDIVAVVFETDGVSLTLQAKAMGDCSAGGTLDVVNTQSKKVIETVCTGPGQAVVGPRADEIKAANYQLGGQGRLVTASLR